MTQEEKQLLIKDLCVRLPYSIWGLHRGEDLPLYVIDDSGSYMVLGYNAWFNLDTVPFKPYLRPMSSMTEDEKKEIYKFYDTDGRGFPDSINEGMVSNYVDYCNAHHFDFRGLIPMGLAMEAPEGMYE